MRSFSLLALLLACSPPMDELRDPLRLATTIAALPAGTVENAVTSGCSTTSVKGLSVQIVAMMNCLHPGAMVEILPGGNLSYGSAVFGYLQAPARDALEAALAAKSGTNLHINSMFRTVAQQYLLYRWYQAGTCSISLAAKPGTSNHESGLAFDTSDVDAWKSTLQTNDFKWLGSADPVHFDYVGPGIVDLGGEDVHAFQALWNLHHPEDEIDEDGLYGPQTAARIQASPADGFVGGVTCPGGPVDPPDAGPIDVGAVDSGPADTGPPDAGPSDLGQPDLGPLDSGAPDADPVSDAGPVEPSDVVIATDSFTGDDDIDGPAESDLGTPGPIEPDVTEADAQEAPNDASAGDDTSPADESDASPTGDISGTTSDVSFGGAPPDAAGAITSTGGGRSAGCAYGAASTPPVLALGLALLALAFRMRPGRSVGSGAQGGT